MLQFNKPHITILMLVKFKNKVLKNSTNISVISKYKCHQSYMLLKSKDWKK